MHILSDYHTTISSSCTKSWVGLIKSLRFNCALNYLIIPDQVPIHQEFISMPVHQAVLLYICRSLLSVRTTSSPTCPYYNLHVCNLLWLKQTGIPDVLPVPALPDLDFDLP